MAHPHESTVARGSHPHPPRPDRPDSEVDVRAIFTFGLGLLLSAIVIQGMIWLLFRSFEGREATRDVPAYPLAAGQDSRLPPEPRLQTDPRGDLRDLRTHEDSVLGTYGWVDKAAGVVRIPIDEAMRITAQRGLPARSGTGDASK
ncbi:MAG: hypothetical protein ABJA98_19805 [Acidobacteriota bacterium]